MNDDDGEAGFLRLTSSNRNDSQELIYQSISGVAALSGHFGQPAHKPIYIMASQHQTVKTFST